jgi:hypothetical protein
MILLTILAILDGKASTRPGSTTRAPWFLCANQTPESFQHTLNIKSEQSEHPEQQ